MPTLCDVKPLLDYCHKQFVAKATSTKELAPTAELIIKATGWVDNGVGYVKFDDRTYTFGPDSVFGLATMDGAIVTDMSLFLKSFLMTLLAPAVGQRYSTDPIAIADTLRLQTLRFFSGGNIGGAILDTGRWSISPHWLPIPSPNPVAATSATIEDPVARTINRYTTVEQDAADVQKGAKVSLDPFYTLLAMGGTSLIHVAPYTRRDSSQLSGWEPTLVQTTQQSEDVLSRVGTFVADDEASAHFGSSAYDEMITSGYLLGALQLPRVFAHVSLLDRLVADGTVAGRWWFRSQPKDFAISGITAEALAELKAHHYEYKLSWLDDMRGVPLRPPCAVTARAASPLFSTMTSVSFKSGVRTQAYRSLELTTARRAWMRSDPNWPTKYSWLANSSLSRLSEAWVDVIDKALYDQLEAIT